MFITSEGRFHVINVEYENSGGGCMVLVVTLYDHTTNATQYIYYNEEGGTLATVDYVFSDVGYEERMSLAYYDEEKHKAFGDYTIPAELNELFEYAWLEYIKHDCRRFKTTATLRLDRMPKALEKLMPNGYKQWLIDNEEDLVTDGEKILIDERFSRIANVKKERVIEMIEALQQFDKGYKALLDAIMTADGVDINDTKAIDQYPFTESFDEIKVSDWIYETVSELKQYL